ncbi:hypothetical protein EV426DRAFT_645225 [Tirmania nivea]|nr:hypothetical protein EV426DRAFT_645225 [Tirmania nivea]
MASVDLNVGYCMRKAYCGIKIYVKLFLQRDDLFSLSPHFLGPAPVVSEPSYWTSNTELPPLHSNPTCLTSSRNHHLYLHGPEQDPPPLLSSALTASSPPPTSTPSPSSTTSHSLLALTPVPHQRQANILADIRKQFSNINVDYRNQFLSLITITCYDATNYTVPEWQLPPESQDQPDLPTDTEDESSDLEIVDDEEEAAGSDNEQGDYITEEEAVQYATITLGEEIV